jgi:hypothetical protein
VTRLWAPAPVLPPAVVGLLGTMDPTDESDVCDRLTASRIAVCPCPCPRPTRSRMSPRSVAPRS